MRGRLKILLLIAAVALCGYFVSRTNYLVFHGFAETFSISAAVCIFIISWNTRRTAGGFFTVLGFSYLSYAVLIMFHLLAYKGMSIFPSAIGANRATQLWIAATFLHAVSIPAAFCALRRQFPVAAVAAAYASGVGLLLMSIFIWDLFPACFVEGKGLTEFKVASEYVISAIYGISIALLYRFRASFDETVFQRILLSLYLCIAAEMMFTLYTDPFGITNFGGHLLRIISSFMAYRALVESAFLNPYAILFRDLKQSEAELQQQRDFVTTVVNTAAGFIAVVDARGVIELCNSSCTLLSGTDVGRLRGAGFHDIFGSGDAPDFETVRDKVVVEGTCRFETFSRSTFGNILTVWVATPLFSKTGQISFIILVGTDITERKALEVELARKRDEAMEASRLKSVFLATMSHEIRTPMNGIIGMTDLLLDTSMEAQQKEMAGVVRDSAHALLGIINDILDFSKIEANKMEIETIDFALLPVVEGIAELLSAKAREKGIGIVTHVDPAIPPRVKGDPGRLRQVIMNLAGNALKFTNTGEIYLTASYAGWEGGRVRVRFEVRDTGIGISKEGIGRLFEPFVQLDSTPCRSRQGTGLGLAISRRLVGLMGGGIDVVSEEGKGSTFSFELPLAVVAHNIVGRPAPFEGLSVLVATDSPALRASISAYLTSWGIRAPALTRIDWRETGYSTHGCDVLIFENSEVVSDVVDIPEDSRVIEIIDGCFTTDVSRLHIRLGRPFRQSHLFDALSRLLGKEAHYFPKEKEARASSKSTFRSTSGALILVAEDNPVNQQVALLQLNKLGYSAHAVSTGEEVIQSLHDARYDLVLMDCQMPVMDGYEATRLIRLMEQGTGRHVPILAMTANAMGSDRDECLAAGMDDYISKPVQPEALGKLLETYLDKTERESLEAQPAASAAASLNLDYLQEVFGDNERCIVEILNVFLTSSPPLIQTAQNALVSSDCENFVRAAHQLKGASASIGAEHLAGVASDLEQKARSGEIEVVSRRFSELLEAYEALRVSISGYIDIDQD